MSQGPDVAPVPPIPPVACAPPVPGPPPDAPPDDDVAPPEPSVPPELGVPPEPGAPPEAGVPPEPPRAELAPPSPDVDDDPVDPLLHANHVEASAMTQIEERLRSNRCTVTPDSPEGRVDPI